jgi:phosphoribosylformimino-5-aminoimidazole carboxamide ribotide isomerase
MVGLDHRQVAGSDGTFRREVAVRGWLAQAGLELRAALARLEGIDLGGVVVTDIDRDGTGDGPDLEGLSDVLGATALPVLASGGVATGADIAALAGLEVNGRRLAGVIVGRALLSGKLSIEEAVAACRR